MTGQKKKKKTVELCRYNASVKVRWNNGVVDARNIDDSKSFE